MSAISDPVFKEKILALIIKDRTFLKICAPLLSKKDFEINNSSSRIERVQADLAKLSLSFYEQYNDPIGTLIRNEIDSYSHKHRLPDSWKSEARHIVKDILKKKIKAPNYIIDKIIEFKKEQARKNGITKLIDLQEAGDLDDNTWQEVMQEGLLSDFSDKYKPEDYFKNAKKRAKRRKYRRQDRFPLSFIDPLDRRVPRLIARGHLGLILAPYKRGKSLMLLHLAVALVLQNWNVLYFTLEDPREDTEDRFDAALSFIPINELNKAPKRFIRKFEKFKRHVRTRLKIVDGTGGGISVDKIISIYQQERNNGFLADAVIIDYDEEIEPKKKHQDRRMDFDEIYRDLRQRLASDNDLLVWLAAQSKRGTSANKIISGDDASEDISKIKKASCCVSMGQGDWGEDSIYLHIAAHKHGRQHIGCNIMPDLERMRIFDADKTRKAIEEHPEMKRRKD
jgi:AAA domain-containing protein